MVADNPMPTPAPLPTTAKVRLMLRECIDAKHTYWRVFENLEHALKADGLPEPTVDLELNMQFVANTVSYSNELSDTDIDAIIRDTIAGIEY